MGLNLNLPTSFCRVCKRQQPVFVILDKGEEIIHCAECGSDLAAKENTAPAAKTEDNDAYLAAIESAMKDVEPIQEAEPLQLEPIEADVYHDGALGAVLIADDEALVRGVVSEVFLETGMAKEVINCPNGTELVKKYGEWAVLGEAPIGLIVCDLEMPGLNGLQTAMTVRKFEHSRQLPPAPILFFSGRKRDVKLDAAMRKLHPAMYMYKGADTKGGSAKDALRQRVRKVVHLLTREMQL